MRHLIISLSLTASSAVMASATTYVVNAEGTGDFPIIQAAIDSVLDGDVIELTDGTFTGDGNRDIDYLGKGITLRSQSGNPESCVIDCEWSSRGISFTSGENRLAVLEGVSISRAAVIDDGWAVLCVGSSPTILHCRMINCGEWYGSAISCEGTASPLIAYCDVVGNGTQDSNAGICCGGSSSPEVVHCRFAAQDGGNIGCRESSSPLFRDCVITGNRSSTWTPAVQCAGDASARFVSCTISGNYGTNGCSTGGILCLGGEVILERTILYGNCGDGGEDGHEAWIEAGARIVFICSAVDSSGVAGPGEIEFVGDQVLEDPQFCDPVDCQSAPTADGDYSISCDSPCVAEHSPCGELIGALGVGCGGTHLNEATWGGIKALFRE